MPNASVTVTCALGGQTFGTSYVLTDENMIVDTVTCAAAQAGTLSTRTDNSAGTLTLASGHTITTGMKFDLYWSAGSRRNITAGTVSGTSVPFVLGDSLGDNLPIATTAIRACPVVTIPVSFDPDNLTFATFKTAAGGQIVFWADTAEAYAFDFASTNLWFWDNTQVAAQLFGTDPITEIRCSTSALTASAFNIGILSSVQ